MLQFCVNFYWQSCLMIMLTNRKAVLFFMIREVQVRNRGEENCIFVTSGIPELFVLYLCHLWFPISWNSCAIFLLFSRGLLCIIIIISEDLSSSSQNVRSLVSCNVDFKINRTYKKCLLHYSITKKKTVIH